MFPQATPSIAEVYGVSFLAAIVYLMYLQAEWHGIPINSGFHTAYISKGGYKLGYLLSKYLKAVLTNLILCAVILLLMFSQGFQSVGCEPVMLVWAFVNPFFIFAFSNLLTLKYDVSYKYTQRAITQMAAFLGVFVLIQSGTIAYANS